MAACLCVCFCGTDPASVCQSLFLPFFSPRGVGGGLQYRRAIQPIHCPHSQRNVHQKSSTKTSPFSQDTFRHSHWLTPLGSPPLFFYFGPCPSPVKAVEVWPLNSDPPRESRKFSKMRSSRKTEPSLWNVLIWSASPNPPPFCLSDLLAPSESDNMERYVIAVGDRSASTLHAG